MKPWLFAALLVAWGNLQHPLIGATAQLPGGSWQFVAAGAALVIVSLFAARAMGLDAAGLGLRRAATVRGAANGALVGGVIAAVDVGVLRLAPMILGTPVTYGPLESVTRDELVRHIAFFLPLGAVVPEEVAFRGTLLGALTPLGPARAVIWSAAAFAAWHGTVAVFTVMHTTMPVVLIIPAIAGALVILFFGGVIMALLRLSTGLLATTIAAHWAFNATILIGLWAGR